MSRQQWAMIGYGGLMIVNAAVTQLAISLGEGKVPLPVEWQWLVPTLVAALTALTALLPSLKGGRRR